MKFEVTYYDARKDRECTIKLTDISMEKVKANFIGHYCQTMYKFISIKEV